MKLYDSIKIYKKNIYNTRLYIYYFIIFTFTIFIDSFVNSKNNNISISELELLYNNLSIYREWIYIFICTVLALKILSFTDNYFYILRVGSKDKIWSLVIKHIVITNFIISVYLVVLSYISALLFSKQIYMEFNKIIVLLVALILLYTICLSLFNMVIFIVKTITGSKNIAYLLLISILLKEVLGNSLILEFISLNKMYFENSLLAFLNVLKFGGFTILLFELGRFFYKKQEIYNTKNNLTSGINYYE